METYFGRFGAKQRYVTEMPMLQSKGFEFHAPFEMRHNSDRIPSHSASNRSAELTV